MPETIIVSFSEIDTFRQCPHKHELGYKDRWRSPTTSPALSRGTLMHNVFETHYRLIKAAQDAGQTPDLEAIMREAMRTWLYDPRNGSQTEEQELVEWIYIGYCELYGTDPNWKILAVEHTGLVWLPTERGGRSRFRLKIKLDLIVKEIDTGQIWVVDHKSGKDLPNDKMLDIDDQFGLYVWGLQRLGKKVMGSLHNACRTHRNKDQVKHPQPLDERFRRSRLYRTPLELETVALEAYRTVRTAYGHYSRPGEAPRAPDSDRCRWRCDFTEACLQGRKGNDEVQFLRDTGYVQDWTRH